MNTEVHRKNFRLQNSHWWFVGMKRFYEIMLDSYARDLSGKNILDIGCGVGANVQILSKFGDTFGIDIDMLPLELSGGVLSNRKTQSSVTELPFKNESFSFISALNVIEHVERDEIMLKEIWRVGRKNSRTLIVTSAFPFLWGANDIASHHFRRYLQAELRSKVMQAGFRIIRLGYVNIFAFHFLAIVRMIQKLFPVLNEGQTDEIRLPSRFVNWFFTKELILEAEISRRFNLPYGISLFCILEK